MAQAARRVTLQEVGFHSKHQRARRSLVVEDDPLVARSLVRHLEQQGLSVTVISSLGAVAALDGTFEGAVVDIDLPDGCGLDICSLLPEGMLRSAPVFFSATTDATLRSRAAATGVYVPKEQGTLMAVSALNHQIARLESSSISGTYVRPAVLSAQHSVSNVSRFRR